jgi:hypothetical protein
MPSAHVSVQQNPMPFYSIEIPTPNIPSTHLNALAQIRTPNEYIEVFWWPEKRKPIFCIHGQWYIQPDGNICASVATLLGWEQRTVNFSDLFLFERSSYSHGHAASANDERNFMECEWSDYAVDCMAFQVNVVRARRQSVVYE